MPSRFRLLELAQENGGLFSQAAVVCSVRVLAEAELED